MTIEYTKLSFLPVIVEALTNIGSYPTRGKLHTLTRAFTHISTHIHTQRERRHSAGSVLVSHVHSLSLSCDAVCLADCWSSQIHLAWQQNDPPDLWHCVDMKKQHVGGLILTVHYANTAHSQQVSVSPVTFSSAASTDLCLGCFSPV